MSQSMDVQHQAGPADADEINTEESLHAASGSMEDFEMAADLIAKVTRAETNGDALADILSYRLEVRTKAFRELRHLLEAQQGFRVDGLGRITAEDDGILTLQFKDDAAAQRFLHNYRPDVDVREMPLLVPDTVACVSPEAEAAQVVLSGAIAADCPECMRDAAEVGGFVGKVWEHGDYLTRAEANAQTEKAVQLALESSSHEIESLKVRLELALLPREVTMAMLQGTGAAEAPGEPVAPSIADARDRQFAAMERELSEWHKLRDPIALHTNLLRGIPARLTPEMLYHIAGAYVLGIPENQKPELSDLEAAILEVLYNAFSRGDSVERAHAAVCGLLSRHKDSSPGPSCSPPSNVYYRGGRFYEAHTDVCMSPEFSAKWWGRRKEFAGCAALALNRIARCH